MMSVEKLINELEDIKQGHKFAEQQFTEKVILPAIYKEFFDTFVHVDEVTIEFGCFLVMASVNDDEDLNTEVNTWFEQYMHLILSVYYDPGNPGTLKVYRNGRFSVDGGTVGYGTTERL